MISKLGYHSNVMRLNSATVAALAVVLRGLFFALPTVSAQINGTPASVTSINSGGHLNSTPGVPSSITSLGPRGIQPQSPFSNQPACCINPLFPVNPNPPLIPRHHHHQRGQFFPAGGGVVYVPYAYPVIGDSDAGDATADQQEEQWEEEHRGGPTIFDRRGPGTPAPYADAYPQPRPRPQTPPEVAPAAPPAEIPVPDQPLTLLVFKDGHQLEVQNYAVVGDTLYDLTPGRHHKIPLAELDLTSTAKQNDDRGIDFRLPKTETNK